LWNESDGTQKSTEMPDKIDPHWNFHKIQIKKAGKASLR